MKNGPEDLMPGNELEEDGLDIERLESELRQALLPRSPSAGFADRLMARALAGHRAPILTPRGLDDVTPLDFDPAPLRPLQAGRRRTFPSLRPLGWVQGGLAAALLLTLIEGGVAVKRLREHERRVAAATAQFQTTERVTFRALLETRQQLQRAGVPLSPD